MVEALEVAVAAIVTAGLVAGNLLLFSPLRSDDRLKALGSQAREASIKHPMSAPAASAVVELARIDNMQD